MTKPTQPNSSTSSLSRARRITHVLLRSTSEQHALSPSTFTITCCTTHRLHCPSTPPRCCPCLCPLRVCVPFRSPRLAYRRCVRLPYRTRPSPPSCRRRCSLCVDHPQASFSACPTSSVHCCCHAPPRPLSRPPSTLSSLLLRRSTPGSEHAPYVANAPLQPALIHQQ